MSANGYTLYDLHTVGYQGDLLGLRLGCDPRIIQNEASVTNQENLYDRIYDQVRKGLLLWEKRGLTPT